MPTKTVKLEVFANELGKFTEERLEEYKAATARGVVASVPELVRQSPVDTGLYAASWDFTVEERAVVLGNTAPHAPIIERGARPFKPPIQPLLAWAKRVLGDSSQPPKYSPNVWRLAVGTQKKIMKEGMQPKHIMERNLPMIIEKIREEFELVG